MKSVLNNRYCPNMVQNEQQVMFCSIRLIAANSFYVRQLKPYCGGVILPLPSGNSKGTTFILDLMPVAFGAFMLPPQFMSRPIQLLGLRNWHIRNDEANKENEINVP